MNKNLETANMERTNSTTAVPLTANRQYKDTVFRMLFSEKKELLSLYNAVNGTDYDDPEELEITTDLTSSRQGGRCGYPMHTATRKSTQVWN